jgi:hypothetical protein
MESKKNIVDLNEEGILKLGFSKSGDNFIGKKFPIVLKENPDGDGYLVDWSFTAPKPIKEVTPPPPMKTNSDLVRVMITLAPILISGFTPKSMSEEEKGKEIFEYSKSLVEFEDKDIILYPNFNQINGFMYVPGNYKSFTIMTGYERKMGVVFEDGSEETLYTNPQAISYKFLKELFKKSPTKVTIFSDDEKSEEPYFGLSAFIN